MQSRANDRLHDQTIEEMKEIEHMMTEEALNLVRKEDDLWRYQNEKEEAKKNAGRRKQRNDEEMAWAPPRNKSDWLDWEEARSMEQASGGWSQKGKRRCQRSLSCRMRLKATKWILMAKATANRQNEDFRYEKYQAKEMRR